MPYIPQTTRLHLIQMQIYSNDSHHPSCNSAFQSRPSSQDYGFHSKVHNLNGIIGFNRNIYIYKISCFEEYFKIMTAYGPSQPHPTIPTSSAKRFFLQHSMALKAPWLAPQLRHSDDLSPLPNALDKVRSKRGRPETIPVISSRMLLLCLCVLMRVSIKKYGYNLWMN